MSAKKTILILCDWFLPGYLAGGPIQSIATLTQQLGNDIDFKINGNSLKKFASQGQQKSFLIALKLAQFEFVKKNSGENPILLFDDIFDKLDETRVGKIIEMVNNSDFGQLFISDTHPERTESIIKSTHQSYKIFNL